MYHSVSLCYFLIWINFNRWTSTQGKNIYLIKSLFLPKSIPLPEWTETYFYNLFHTAVFSCSMVSPAVVKADCALCWKNKFKEPGRKKTLESSRPCRPLMCVRVHCVKTCKNKTLANVFFLSHKMILVLPGNSWIQTLALVTKGKLLQQCKYVFRYASVRSGCLCVFVQFALCPSRLLSPLIHHLLWLQRVWPAWEKEVWGSTVAYRVSEKGRKYLSRTYKQLYNDAAN